MRSPRAQQVWMCVLCATLMLALAGCVTPAPRVAPPPGIYNCPETVTITDARAGAAIFYTTDGSAPTTSSQRYTAPFAISSTDKVQAIAQGAGAKVSQAAAVSYTCTFTRGDFATLIQQQFGLPQPKRPVIFPDVSPKDPVYSAAEAAAAAMNPLILCPGCSLNRNFFPNRPITRAISTIALVRILAAKGQLQFLTAAESARILSNSADANHLPPAARPYFATAISSGIISFLPGNTIQPEVPVTQAEMTALLARLQTQFNATQGKAQ